MAITHFHDIPHGLMVRRLARPAVFVFFFGFLLMGFLSSNAGVNLPALQMAQYQFSKLPALLGKGAQLCPDEMISDFQRERCAEHWMDLGTTAAWVLFPFVLVFVFYRFGVFSMRKLYADAERKLQEGRGLFVGTLTDPPEAPNDLFGWAYCLRCLTLDLGKNQQLKIFVPYETEIPKPGIQMAVADLGKHWGRSRYLAAPYMPHVAVVRGG